MATIYQREYTRKDGTTYKRWCGEVNYNYKKKSFTGKTKKEVEKKIRDYETELNMYGSTLEKKSITLTEWMHTHLFTNMLPTISASTFERYKGIYDNYIATSSLGNMQLKNIKQIHLQEYFNGLTTLSAASMKKTQFLLNGAFKSAISNNLIRVNPLTDFKLPTSQKEEKIIEVFTLEEQKAYIEALADEMHGFLFYLTLNTGMRLGEVIGLKWEYINLEKNTITIAESINRSKVYAQDGSFESKMITKSPKTQKGKREIPIPTFLLPKLKALKLRSTTEYVFVTRSQRPLRPEYIRKCHIRICKKANIKEISFHALRHTYATRLIEAGENIKTVQELLGHADVTTTMNVYTHVLDETKKAAADKLTALHENMFFAVK
ncbi:MAG: site-specific integrase [Cellulosilyticum sp.]|nr:site-specific integrase [Cellulosilyticum sp.]